MKYILIFAFFFSIRPCQAQDDHLLRIVSYHGKVTVDGDSVKSEELIFATSEKLSIAENSYAYILTFWGYSAKLGKGDYNVREFQEDVIKKKSKRNSLSGAVTCPPNDPLILIGLEGTYGPSLLMGDSIYLRWRPRFLKAAATIKPPYVFQVHSIFDDLVYEKEVSSNFIKLNFKQAVSPETNPLIIVKGCSQRYLVKFMEPEQSAQIRDDLSSIKTDQLQRSVLDLVIFESNQLNLDLMFNLDKIATLDTTALPADLKNYISLLKTKYEM